LFLVQIVFQRVFSLVGRHFIGRHLIGRRLIRRINEIAQTQ